MISACLHLPQLEACTVDAPIWSNGEGIAVVYVTLKGKCSEIVLLEGAQLFDFVS